MRNLQTHTKFSFYHVWEGGDTLRETDLEAASFGRRGAREDSLWPGDKSKHFSHNHGFNKISVLGLRPWQT
jgi:hypothetical protein